MTEVEEELARTKALLRQLQSGGQDAGPSYQERGSEDLQGTRSSNDDRRFDTLVSPVVESSRQASTADERDGAIDKTNDRPSLESNLERSYETPSQSNAQTNPIEPTATSPNRPILSPTSRRTSYRRTHGPQRESETHSVTTSGLSLEAPPSSGSFEWDERTGKTSGDRFVDGMASLTSRSNEGGYLGTCRSTNRQCTNC